MEILDADDVAHALQAPGGAAVPGLVALFGSSILRLDKGIDRVKLGKRVFGDARVRVQVDQLMHPLIRAQIDEWIEKPTGHLKAAVIPLLFEAGWANEWDVIVCLVSSEASQIERLMQIRGLSEEQARLRIATQMPPAEKAARSHYVVVNTADAGALAQKAAEVWRFLMETFE